MTPNSRGFTLVEITVVVVLSGIIAAVVFARSISTDQMNIVGQVDKIRNHIRYAQSMAMKRNEPWGISCNASQYWLSDITLNAVKLPGTTTDQISLADLGHRHRSGGHGYGGGDVFYLLGDYDLKGQEKKGRR